MVLLNKLLTNRCWSSGLSTSTKEVLPLNVNGDPAMGVKAPLEAMFNTFTPPWPVVPVGAKTRFDAQFKSRAWAMPETEKGDPRTVVSAPFDPMLSIPRGPSAHI